MKVDKKTVLKTAKLATIEIGEKEIDKYHKEFNDILKYVEKLEKVDVKNVKPTAHVLELGTPLRKDEPSKTLTRDKAIENHKGPKGKFFTVPKFID